MSTFKKAKVVMLPTNEPSKIGNLATYQKRSLAKVIKEGINPKDSTVQFWNLYIISDDEIKEGDWFISNKEIHQYRGDIIPEILKSGYRKIIATTDSSLWRPSHKYASDVILLPQPSQQFIEKFIEEYNRGNVITDVLIEYELISNEEYFGNTINPDDDVPYFDERLKINSKDNTITIKKVKDSWNREEVLKIAMDCMMYGYNGLPNNLTPIQGMNKWIEENL